MSATAPPLQLFVELTNACNLRCAHCYVEAGGARRAELPASVACRLLDEYEALGGTAASVSGGEPLLHPGWPAVVRHARSLALQTLVLTNGVEVDDAAVALLADAGAGVAISLEAATEAPHDAIRGRGTFHRTIAALRRLVEAGLGPATTLMFTPMAANGDHLPGLVSFARAAGIGTVYVSLLENRGRASERWRELAIPDRKLPAFLYTVLALQDRFPEVRLQCLNLKLFTERLRGVPLETEPLDRTLRVTADGDAYLTAYADDEPFFLGRYEPGNLRSLWEAGKVQHALAAARRRGDAEPCAGCTAWPWCQGGSAVFSWNRNGSFQGDDGYCAAKKALLAQLAVHGEA